MFFTLVAWVCLVCLRLCEEEGSSPVSAITERRDMGLYEVSLSLLGFGMGTMLASFHMCGIMLVLRAVFNMVVMVILLIVIFSVRGLGLIHYVAFPTKVNYNFAKICYFSKEIKKHQK